MRLPTSNLAEEEGFTTSLGDWVNEHPVPRVASGTCAYCGRYEPLGQCAGCGATIRPAQASAGPLVGRLFEAAKREARLRRW